MHLGPRSAGPTRRFLLSSTDLRHLLRIVPLLALSWLVAACGSGTGTGPGDDVDPDPGQTIGPAGGQAATEGATLSVPAGALSEETEIVIEPTTASAEGVGDDYLVVDGALYDFGPDGLVFDSPATLTVAYDPASLPEGVSEVELKMLHVTPGGTQVLESSVDEAGNTVSAAISGFSAFGVGVPVGGMARIACSALAPAANSGIPLDRISIGSLPTNLDLPAIVQARSISDTLTSYGVVDVDAEGNAEIVVPIHPSGMPEGGDVVLNVTDGTSACAGIPFTIEALPPAPGELGAIADALQAVLARQAEVFETTIDNLVSTPPDQLPTTLFPIALVQSIIDHPDNPRSLRALANGTSPDVGDARLDLLEPLLARTGLRDALTPVPASAPAAASQAGPARVGAAQCVPSQITSAGILDACMSAASSSAFELEGASGKVLGDISRATGYLGLVPGVPALGAASSIGGAVTWAALNSKQRTAALYPSTFTAMTVSPSPSTFLEDQDGPGTWTATVQATNQPWDLGKELLEGSLQAAGVASAFDKAQVAGPEVNGLLSWFMTGPVAAEALSQGTDLVIAAQVTPEIPVTDDAYSESSILGNAFARTSHTEYEPRQAGSATLSIRTEDGAFGGAQISDQQALSVEAIEIVLTPAEALLAGGEGQTFTVSVRNSEHPEMVEVDPTVPLQGTIESLTIGAGGSHTLEYTAPGEPNPTSPDFVTVRHTAATGALAFSESKPSGFAVVRFPDITIIPPTDCIEPGQTAQFTAEIVGADDMTLEWSADVGTIDSSTGAYTAPAGATSGQTATITATSTTNANVTDNVIIELGGCSCSWTALVDASLFESADGDQGIVSFGPDGSLIGVTLGDLSTDQALNVTINPDQFGVPVGSTGTYSVTFGGTMGAGSGELGINSPDAQSAQIILETNTGTAVRGRAFGSALMILDNGQTREISIDMGFRLEDLSGVPLEGGSRIYECVVGEQR